MTPQPTDADYQIATKFWHLPTNEKSAGVLTGIIAEVRASAYAQGRADEREACARIAEARVGDCLACMDDNLCGRCHEDEAIAAAIRARAAQEGASDV